MDRGETDKRERERHRMEWNEELEEEGATRNGGTRMVIITH